MAEVELKIWVTIKLNFQRVTDHRNLETYASETYRMTYRRNGATSVVLGEIITVQATQRKMTTRILKTLMTTPIH